MTRGLTGRRAALVLLTSLLAGLLPALYASRVNIADAVKCK